MPTIPDAESLDGHLKWVIGVGCFDPWGIEDIGERIVLEGACRQLVELGILKEMPRERKYFAASVGMPVLRDEPYFRLREEAYPLASQLALSPLRPSTTTE